MQTDSNISQSTLCELLEYNAETGILTWKRRGLGWFKCESDQRRWNKRYAGKRAFTSVDRKGYAAGKIFGRTCKGHRVVWIMVHGRDPKDQVDHINGKRDDNRISNLREVSNVENSRNQKLRHDNKSGITGVRWREANSKWAANIKVAGIMRHLGYFEKFDDAVECRLAAEKKFNFHGNHGKRT